MKKIIINIIIVVSVITASSNLASVFQKLLMQIGIQEIKTSDVRVIFFLFGVLIAFSIFIVPKAITQYTGLTVITMGIINSLYGLSLGIQIGSVLVVILASAYLLFYSLASYNIVTVRLKKK